MRHPHFPSIFLTHPFELAIAFVLLLSGVQSVLSGAAYSKVVDNAAGFVLAITWQIGIIIGSCCVLFALFARGRLNARGERAKSIGRTIERVGLVLIATSFLIYVAVLGLTGAGGIGFALATSLAIALACIFRSIALRKTDQAVIHQLRMLNGADPYDGHTDR